MKKLSLFVLLTAALAIGCKGGKKFVGSWDTSFQQYSAVANFAAGGNCDFTIQAVDTPLGKVTIELAGTYQGAEDRLTITFNTASIDGIPPTMQAQGAQLKAGFEKLMIGKTRTSPVTWESGDSFTITDAGSSATFTRRK